MTDPADTRNPIRLALWLALADVSLSLTLHLEALRLWAIKRAAMHERW